MSLWSMPRSRCLGVDNDCVAGGKLNEKYAEVCLAVPPIHGDYA